MPRTVNGTGQSPRGMFANYIMPPFLTLPLVLYLLVWIPELLSLASASPGSFPDIDIIREGLAAFAALQKAFASKF